MSSPGKSPFDRGAVDPEKVRFGTFEVDLRNRELRNRGIRVRLQEKPFRILELLLERSGELVTREELFHHLWPGLNVNFEHSLNTAVNILRGALGDSSRSGRFIETRSGLGYRFVAQVEQIARPELSLHIAAGSRSSQFSAYEDYLKGRHFAGKLTEDDLRRSVAHFESAITQDPDYAPAYAGLADVYTLFAFFGMLSPLQAGRRAKDLAAHAIALNDAVAEVHLAVATVKSAFEWDWHSAEAGYRRALDLNPKYAEGHHRYAALLSRTGRPAEALREIRRAQELHPLSLGICAEAGWIQCMADDAEAAIEQSWKMLGMDPRFAPAQYTLGLAYERLGMMDEAFTEFENARICSGNNPTMAAGLGHAYAVGGMPEKASAILRELEGMSADRYISHYWTSLVCVGLGEHDRALDEIDKACNHRDVWLTWLNADPRFEPLRSYARFKQVLALVGLKSATC